MTSKQLGDFGEDTACEFLISKGFEIVTRNYHSRWGEIDVVAANAEFLVFAEVKTRSRTDYGTPAEFVDSRKQEKLRITAELYLQENETQLQPRFDVIEVFLTQNAIPSVRWITNAL
jgi:putative endonuclease